MPTIEKKKRLTPIRPDVLATARAATLPEQVPVDDISAGTCSDCGAILVGRWAWWDTPQRAKRVWERAGLVPIAKGADLDDLTCGPCKKDRDDGARQGDWDWALDTARANMGHLPGNRRWTEQAVCASADPEAWFPDTGQNIPKAAKDACMSCPVRAECLISAVANRERFGMWAGFEHTRLRRLYAELGLPDEDQVDEVIELPAVAAADEYTVDLREWAEVA